VRDGIDLRIPARSVAFWIGGSGVVGGCREALGSGDAKEIETSKVFRELPSAEKSLRLYG
jgi:hypothetical protein